MLTPALTSVGILCVFSKYSYCATNTCTSLIQEHVTHVCTHVHCTCLLHITYNSCTNHIHVLYMYMSSTIRYTPHAHFPGIAHEALSQLVTRQWCSNNNNTQEAVISTLYCGLRYFFETMPTTVITSSRAPFKIMKLPYYIHNICIT